MMASCEGGLMRGQGHRARLFHSSISDRGPFISWSSLRPFDDVANRLDGQICVRFVFQALDPNLPACENLAGCSASPY